MGNGGDLKIYHDATNTRNKIECHNGELRIDKGASSETLARFIPDGAVELFHNDSKKIETKSNGVRFLDSDGNLALQLDTNAGTQGYIYADSNQIQLQTGGGETSVKCFKDGATELYFNNVKKVENSTYGI